MFYVSICFEQYSNIQFVVVVVVVGDDNDELLP